LAGDIVAVGDDVTSFQVGQRVVAANSAPCDQCFFCRRGLENLCEDLLFNNGAYAEYIRIPERIVKRNTYLISDRVTYHDAALVEPLACVLRGFEETNPRPGDTISIIGLGPIGLMFVKLAKLYGCRVIAVGRRQTQLDRAAVLGADELLEASGNANPVPAIRRMTQGRGVDIAIEAVGKPETWHWAANMVRRGGTVNFFGGCPNDSKVSLDTALLHYSEITCKATFHHTPAYIRKALDLICAGHVSASFFVNREEPLSNLLEVMRHLMSHNGHLKTAILP
jgi:L-iditol 2-dehydrogenase